MIKVDHFRYSIISYSFLEKAELEQQLKPHITEKDYDDLLNATWDALIETGFSFVIADKSNHIVGVSLSFDVNTEPEYETPGPQSIIFEYLETVEAPIRFVV